jgi:molybdate transport system substrate-binding protein
MQGAPLLHNTLAVRYLAAMILRLTTTIAMAAWACMAGAAEPLTIAVASNFSRPAAAIAERFEKESGQPVRVTTASTGQLYAQIMHGAPFDVLLAADVERPRLLEESGRGVAGTRFSYAAGSLVLWSRDPELAGHDCRAALDTLGDRRLAIANPETAPYGAAARQFLQSAGLWDKVSPRIVYGENIAQTLQFVVSGNASLGLVAGSEAADPRLPAPTCRWDVPQAAHEPIVQQAILLQPSRAGAKEFLEFLRGTTAHEIIRNNGYTVPP